MDENEQIYLSDSETDEDEEKILIKQKYIHQENHNINGYNKIIILKHLENKGYDKEIFKKFTKLDREMLIEYVNKQAENSQIHVKEECKTEMFQSLNDWLDILQYKIEKDCQYEIPMMLKLIAETELHPVVKNENDIDFASLYNFLSDIMRGYPTKKLNKATEAFLKETFDDLTKTVQSVGSSFLLQKLRDEINLDLIGVNRKITRINSKSLNPLNLE